MDFKESIIDILAEFGYDNLEDISNEELSELVLRYDITYLDILGYNEIEQKNYEKYVNYDVLWNKGA